MKKLIALMLVLALASTLTLSALAENAPAGGPPPDRTFGTLSMLNMTEEEYLSLISARGLIGERLGEGEPREGEPPEGLPPEGAPPEGLPPKNTIVYYDTLDALLMALNAGDINNIEIYQSVARYLCATNDNLMLGPSFDTDKASETFAQLVQTGVNGNDFAFLMMADNAALRDEFNAAIADMKADGTLDRLVKEQIDDLVNGGEIEPIALPKIDGAETVTVAVTGALPPMDYVAADGTPAGFNTAVLAEIGQRTGKNIEIVVVDSVGRAAALASGTVDAVFWTRTSSRAQERAAMTEAEREAVKAEEQASMTEEEIALMDEVSESINFLTYASADMPEGTIVTEPYFFDVLVPVMLAR
ncbi:MAG: transporter substrate-binding domain-containing protein [Clostridia bacterium]|nr:transporter substrate-binding domain-containing protein [Clostridia bacterium]